MPNWKKVLVSGSSAHLNHITASGNISGSQYSTGSFGALTLNGSPNVYGNEHGIGIGAPAPAHSLEIIDAGNNPQIQFSYGPNPTDYHNNIRADVGSALFFFDLIQAGTTYTPLTLKTNSISGSATTTGSFGVYGNDFIPSQNNTHDLGSSTHRWANIYSADLNLSNEETDGNDVDGTTGNWTVQEGKDDIYLINNNTKKKFKIKLEPVGE